MCLPNFIEFKQIDESNAIPGYRNWNNLIIDSLELKSQNRNYIWNNPDGPHEVKDVDSGLYSYNNNYYKYYYNNYNYYYNNNNNYNNYNYNYYNNNNNYYNNYYYYYNYNYYNNYYNNYSIAGIIKQFGKVAIHDIGYRSEYAIIDTIFNIRKLNAQVPKEFLNWIDIFNKRIEQIADKYNCKVISYQDFIETNIK